MRKVLVLAILLIASWRAGLRAQSTNASLSGRVCDPSKSFIADAKLAAIGTATNGRYETTTNTSGEYYLANLPPGLYQIEIENPASKN
jgi:carboxypeptidase family protein